MHEIEALLPKFIYERLILLATAPMGRAWAGWRSGSLWVEVMQRRGGAADKITQSVYEAKTYNKRNHFE